MSARRAAKLVRRARRKDKKRAWELRRRAGPVVEWLELVDGVMRLRRGRKA